MKLVRYTEEQRRQALDQMKMPLNKTIKQVAKETGITEVTLRTWREAAWQRGESLPSGRASQEWSSAQKFHAVLESASLSEQEISAYCRSRGLLPAQLHQWRVACEQANSEPGERHAGAEKAVALDPQRHITQLERELRRKDAALAEAAALLVLRKKADAIWGTGEDE